VGSRTEFLSAWLAAISYSLQLYFDFSGYSDMAIGIAWCFGIRIPLNFNSPYKATNIIDFWRRWHMTLSGLIMAFVYTPMATVLSRFASRNRYKGFFAQILTLGIPAILTFAIIGAWHGRGWTFVVFGLIHGLLF